MQRARASSQQGKTRSTAPTPAQERFLTELLAGLRAAAAGEHGVRLSARRAGLPGELARAFNDLVGTQNRLNRETVRVAKAIGRDGRLGERFDIGPVTGSWVTRVEAVNSLIDNLVRPTNEMTRVISAVAAGDLSQKMPLSIDGRPLKGETARMATMVNSMVDLLSAFSDEVTRVAREVGTEGRLGGQARVRNVSGTWRDLTDNVNQMAANLTDQVRNIALVTTAVANGDLSQKITVDARGEVAELKRTVNRMVDQLRAFAHQVTRVAREVGTDGRLGGQAQVAGVAGTWADLTESVNFMAGNLTAQVRNIAQVTTAVARGDLSQKITVDARGEVAQLKGTINTMVDQLRSFADEVTRVAREVGTDGRLGGQAEVAGVSGTWARLTRNVNQLASNLTTQVRAIAEVATAVTQGDLTPTITVDAAGEVGELKDTINQMIANLRETTTRNDEQDWLKSNLARIGAMLQGHRDLRAVSRLIMSELTPLVGAQHGAFYMAEPGEEPEERYRLVAGYGFRARRGVPTEYATGEGLVGQAALEQKTILVTEVPRSSLRISTGMGEGLPVNIVVLPVLFEDRCLAVLELASFRPFSDVNQAFLTQIVETVGVVLNTILATTRTEELLEQSQSLGTELRQRQEDLERTNAELEEKALELARQNQAIEVKNAEIELARRELEERAGQLALSSKYKSEFLANMSHELRTPLNSLLILARLLADNPEGNLTSKQVEFASSMRDAGYELLNLISDILDLSKVEAGRLDVAMAPVKVADLCAELSQTFRPIASQAALDFVVEVDDALPETITTDGHRVLQILKNLLSNACKFTEEGSVTLRVDRARPGTRFSNPALEDVPEVIAFAVSDTGIGIESDKLLIIFEAFQQAEGQSTRRYGGTGLGLSISREISRLLGGEIQVESEPGRGSTFTLLLPTLGRHAETTSGAPPLAAETQLVEASDPAEAGSALAGTRILLVDDDDRNVYALTSALEQYGIEVLTAEHGRRGLEVLEASSGIDLVLMDIMMPEMDGYETTRAIRQMTSGKDLPIIALTAKAMRGDREKSLAAGASDYITKPVEMGQLLSLLRLWLER